MIGFTLHAMKEIKIVIQGEHLKFVTDLLEGGGATGYTIIHNVSGKGHHGFHDSPHVFGGSGARLVNHAIHDPVEFIR